MLFHVIMHCIENINHYMFSTACVAGIINQTGRFSMKKTFSAVTGVMLALMMLFVSCEQGGVSKAQIDSRELVAVSFTKVEAKSVNVDGIGTVQTPELADLYFQYKAVKNSADTSGVTIGAKESWTDLGGQGLGTVIQLSRGKWDISLRGFATAALRTSAGTSETASTQAIFEGSITTDVGSNLASRTENVNVSLDFTNPSGTGSYSLAVSIPASYASQQAKVKVTVTPASGEAQVQTFPFTAETTAHTYSFSTVNNGIASVKVEYLDASDAAIGDAVTANTLIMTDMTTNGTATISEDNTFGINFSGTSVNGKAEDTQIAKPNVKLYYPGGCYTLRLFEPQEGVTYYYTCSMTDIYGTSPSCEVNIGDIPEAPATPTTESEIVDFSFNPPFIMGLGDIKTPDYGIYVKVIGYRNGEYSDVTEYIRAVKGKWGTAEDEGATTP